MTLCAKCKKNPAVFFITKMENGKTTSEGLCLSCAKELGIAPINQMIDNFGVSDEELENINNQMSEFMESMEGMPGMDGDLSEMLGQIYAIQKESGERVSNVVIMGTGEPLDNYDSAVRFMRMISDENGLNISQRNITISTCGLVPQIYRLADEHLQITLAISLHASNNDKRKSMMPIAHKYSIEELLKACKYDYETNGRRLTFEYSLAGGVNDSPEDARALAHLLKGFMWHVNLIPINPVEEREYVQSDRKSIVNFKNNLEKYGGNVTIRREMGRDIQAACGQLRRRYMTQLEKKEV